MKTLNELVDEIPLGLPMPKDYSIRLASSGKKMSFFTPEGHKHRKLFRKWLNDNELTEQDWYDRYYLNIASASQRPKCKLSGCNELTEFKTCKYIGYYYKDFCCHSHCQLNNWSREGSNLSKIKKSISLGKYFENPENRKLRGVQTKEGFRSHGRYDLDENGLNAFSRTQLAYHASDIGKANDKRRAENLRKDNNPEFARKVKESCSTPEARERNSKSQKIAHEKDPMIRVRQSEIRKRKYREDEDFRKNAFKKLNHLSRGKSGFYYSSKMKDYLSYDSSYELAYMITLDLDESVISFIREPRNLNITYVDGNGDKRWYWIDFIVEYNDGSKELVEIKPSNLINDPINLLKSNSALIYAKINNFKYSIKTETEVFNIVNKESSYEVHNYYQSLKVGFDSTDDKIRKLINNI